MNRTTEKVYDVFEVTVPARKIWHVYVNQRYAAEFVEEDDARRFVACGADFGGNI